MPIDYSRFDNIDVSDDEDEQAYKARKEAEEAGRRASKAQAKECVEAWWQACPKQSQFSVECAARLTRAGTTSLYNNTTGPRKGLGLGFERPLTKDDAQTVQVAEIRRARARRLPGLTVPEAGTSRAAAGVAHRAGRRRGPTFSIEAWDGSKLKARCGRHASWRSRATTRTTAWPQACRRRRRRTSSSAAGCGRRCG